MTSKDEGAVTESEPVGFKSMVKELREVKARLVHSEIEREKFQYVACNPRVIDYARNIGFDGPVGGDMIRVVIEDLLDKNPAKNTAEDAVFVPKRALIDVALIANNLAEATEHLALLKQRISSSES